MIKKQIITDTLYLGGYLEEIEPLHLSLWNRNAMSDELKSFGGYDNFYYFFLPLKNFFQKRAEAFADNWKQYWPNHIKRKGNGGGVWELAVIKAYDEFNSFKMENFLINISSNYSERTYSMGHIPQSLDKLNTFNDKGVEKIKFNPQVLDDEDIDVLAEKDILGKISRIRNTPPSIFFESVQNPKLRITIYEPEKA